MRRIPGTYPYTYEVAADERISVEFFFIEVAANQLFASLNGNQIALAGGTISFSAEQPRNILLLRGFFDVAPNTARIETRISSSRGDVSIGPTLDSQNPETTMIVIGTHTGGPR